MSNVTCSRYATLLLAGMLAACGTESESLPDFDAHPVDVTPSRQWAGGSVTLQSDAFVGHTGEEFVLQLNGVAIIPTSVDPSTLAFTIPSAFASGDHSITSSISGSPVAIGAIEVVGWAGTRTGAEPTLSDPVPWPESYPTGVLISGVGADPVPIFIPTTHTDSIRHFEGLEAKQGYSPSTSYRDWVYIDSYGRVAQLDSLTNSSSVIDSVYFGLRHRFELSQGLWLETGSHLSYLIQDTAGIIATIGTESPWYLIRSHATPVATLVVNATIPDLPIINTLTGAINTTVLGVGSTYAGVFSFDGSSLFLSAAPYWAGPIDLIRVDPADGTILARDSVRSSAWSLAVDPATPQWLYELTVPDETWVLRVRNATDLSVIAEVGSGTAIATLCPGAFPALVVDAEAQQAHVFITRCALGYQIVDFDLLLDTP